MLMPIGFLSSARNRVVAVVLACATIAMCGGCAASSDSHAAKYCAIMSDSVGLYVGNPVTQMGYQIGHVTGVSPSTMDVRVDFTLDERRRLPQDVMAVIRSTSILADRSLELAGNYESGPQLSAGECIPRDRSFTPKSLSAIVESSTKFLSAVTPSDSNNIGAVVSDLDRAIRDQGPQVSKLLTAASNLLDSPDQLIGDMGSIVRNLSLLTSTLSEVRGTVKEILYSANEGLPGAVQAVWGGDKIFEGLVPIIQLAADLETELGGELQQTLDATSLFVRKATPRAPFYASLLNIAPRLINGATNIVNNHQFSIRYRPPLYRIRTPDGVAACNIMNASMPGSCANVQGTPYAVDVALLQYVLTQASR
jgi:phospholipid/cholesterol/gamma-HCH transport system substrate-binding protein